MKKRLIGIFITFALILTLAPLIPAYADTAGQLDHVLVSPTVAEVAIGGTVQFTAQALDSNNVTIPGLTYAWNIVSGGGSINGTGFFTAGNITGLFPNTVQVIVTQNSTIKTAYASVTVIGPLNRVAITPASANVVTGGTVQFTARAMDSNNVTIPGLTYAWNVVSGGGSINGTGFFTAGNITGLFPETVQVIVTQNSTIKTAYASVTVIGPLDRVVIAPASANVVTGGTVQFTARAMDSNNVTIPGLTYSWDVVAGGGGIDGNGLFTAGNITGLFPNTIQVIVTQNSTIKTAYASVTVTAAPIVKSKLPLGWSQGEKNGWDGNTPPGWSQGEKKGWDNGMPPGLAKEKNEPQSKNKKNK